MPHDPERMPPPPRTGQTPLSADVYEHTMIEAFRNADMAFAVMVDDEKGCIWIGSRGRPPRPDRRMDVIIRVAYELVDEFLAATADETTTGQYEVGEEPES